MHFSASVHICSCSLFVSKSFSPSLLLPHASYIGPLSSCPDSHAAECGRGAEAPVSISQRPLPAVFSSILPAGALTGCWEVRKGENERGLSLGAGDGNRLPRFLWLLSNVEAQRPHNGPNAGRPVPSRQMSRVTGASNRGVGSAVPGLPGSSRSAAPGAWEAPWQCGRMNFRLQVISPPLLYFCSQRGGHFFLQLQISELPCIPVFCFLGPFRVFVTNSLN